MKKIKLGNSKKYALIDDENFELINKYKWHLHANYVISYSKTKPRRYIILHRLLLNPPKNKQVDHINHNTLDNRKSNLRICTNTENAYNRFPQKKSLSIFKGVIWKKSHKQWVCFIQHKKSNCRLYALFKNERHAALAYDLWAKDLFGEFAYTNFKVVAFKGGQEIR